MKKHLSILLLAAALLLPTGCSYLPTSAPQAAGEGAGLLIKTEVPAAVPYFETFANSVRSIADAKAPTPEKVQATAALWAAKLPISVEAKAKAVSYVTAKYAKVYPTILKAENVFDKLEEFTRGLEKAGI